MSSNHKNDDLSANKHFFTNVIPVATDSIVNKVKIQRTPGSSALDNKATKSPENIKKSRGRPRIIKNYNDPMRSPMAVSSLKVQQQIYQQKNGKQVMKFGNVLSFNKSPNKKAKSNLNTPNKLNIVNMKSDISPTLDKKVVKSSPKKVVKSVSTGNVSLKNVKKEDTLLLNKSVSNGNLNEVLKIVSSSNQKTPTRNRNNSVNTNIKDSDPLASTNLDTRKNDSVINSSVKDIKKKRSRKNSMLNNLETPIHNMHEGNATITASKNFNETPSSVTSTARKQLSKLSLKLDKSGKAYIEKIDENSSIMEIEENNKMDFLLGNKLSIMPEHHEFVSLKDTEKSSNEDYLKWNNPLAEEKNDFDEEEKKRIMNMLQKFQSIDNKDDSANAMINVQEHKEQSEEDEKLKTPPLSASIRFQDQNTESQRNKLNPSVKLNTDEMEIAIPALLELSPMNMSILNQTPNAKLSANNLTNSLLNSASKFFNMGSPYSLKNKQVEDYDYNKYFTLSPNNKDNVTIPNQMHSNRTPIFNAKEIVSNMQHQNLGMMFNIDSVMQSPNNSIFQAFSQAVYSSPLANNQHSLSNTNVNLLNNQQGLSTTNSNQFEKLENAIDLDLRYETKDHKPAEIANDDFFKQYNPMNKQQDKIPRSPKMILKKKK
ncbi:hypothetical protein ACO0OL_003216 [Hanseniaspora opuntiae]